MFLDVGPREKLSISTQEECPSRDLAIFVAMVTALNRPA
jgi:hypothetical protein